MSDRPKERFQDLLQKVLGEYELLEAQLAGSGAEPQASRTRLDLHRPPALTVGPQTPNLPGTLKDAEPETAVSKDSLEIIDGVRLVTKNGENNHSNTSRKELWTPTSVVPVTPRLFCDPRLATPSDDFIDQMSFVERLDAMDMNAAKHGALDNPEQVKDTVHRMSTDADAEKSKSLSFIMRNIAAAEFHDSGWTATIARSKIFETLTLTAVIVNGLWIAIDADHNPESFILNADPVFIVMENLFCAIFTIEITIRMIAFKSRWAALRDPWFVFDAILVSLTIIETWVMIFVTLVAGGGNLGINISVLRLLRLARLLRLSRIVRAVPELSFMVKGVMEATRGVACTMFLLFGMLYVFGIALKQLSDGTDMGSEYFSTVPHAMFTLFTQGTLLDSITSLLQDVYNESAVCAILVFIVVDVAALTLMNMLVGVLCEVMTQVSQAETELMAMTMVKEQIILALEELDTDKDKLISKSEFVHMICNLKASKALQGVGVDVVSLVDFADYFFQSDKLGEAFEEKWSFDRFMEEVMRVRGVNGATVRDVIELRKFIHSDNTGRNAMLRCIQDNVATLSRNQTKLEYLLLHGSPSKKAASESKTDQ